MHNHLAIAIGNTRIKAVIFGSKKQILEEYAFTHDQLPILEAQLADRGFEHIAIASVVPRIFTCWHNLSQTEIIKTSDVPLLGLYPSMGVDRALAAFGAGEIYGYPILVIDAGTAITLTGIDANKTLFGGAIIAGLRSQFASLHQNTAALPEISMSETLPSRWAMNTISSMQAGIAHILLSGLQAYINDWRSRFSDSKVILTGGDGELLKQWGLQVDAIDSSLIFSGILAINDEVKR